MNKEELILILQKRSQENYIKDEDVVDEEIEKKYLSKLKFRREEDKRRLKLIFIITILILIILFLVFKKATAKEESNPDYIHKSNITFSDLPKNIKDSYVSKIEIEKNLKDTQADDKAKISELANTINELKKELQAKDEEIAKINSGQTLATVEALTSKSNSYEATGCYIMNRGDHNLYDSCKTKIDEFLESIKEYNAKSYEVIAVMDGEDRTYATIVTNSAPNIKDQNLLRDNILEGIARNRTLEASKYLKSKLGKDIVINYVSYVADTANKRGFTIRAYR